MRGRLTSRVRVRWVVELVVVVLVAGAATAVAQLGDNFTNPPAPVPGHGLTTYLTMKGAVTGTFTGGVTVKGHEGAIAVLALQGGLTTPVSTTGVPTGQAACNGIDFRKPTDQSTPKLLHAEGTNEDITTATFSEFATSPTRTQVQTLQIKLVNAHVISVHHVDSTTTGPYEDVTLAPSTVTYTWLPKGISATYNCVAAP